MEFDLNVIKHRYFKSKIINKILDTFNIANYPNLYEIMDIIQLDVENIYIENVLYKIKIRLKEGKGITINNIYDYQEKIESFLGNKIEFEILDFKNLYIRVLKEEIYVESYVENVKKYEYYPSSATFGIEKKQKIVKYIFIEGEKEGVSAVIGYDLEGNKKKFDILEGHVEVGGATRWGKSSFLNTFITSIMQEYTENEVIFAGCDFKMADIYYFRKYKHWKYGVAINHKDFDILLGQLNKEIKVRSKILIESNCRNVIKYNKKNEKKLPYIIFVIDELHQLAVNDEYRGKVHSFMCKCASFGIYVILASQDFTKASIGKCKMNCTQIVGFHTADSTDSETIMGKDANLNDIVYPGRCKIKNSDGVEEVQVFYIEEEEIEAILKPYEKEGNTNI